MQYRCPKLQAEAHIATSSQSEFCSEQKKKKMLQTKKEPIAYNAASCTLHTSNKPPSTQACE